MNTLAQRLGIVSSEIRLEAAARAMLDMLQSKFHLHPTGIVRNIRQHAKAERISDVAGQFKMFSDITVAEARQCFLGVRAIVKGSALLGSFGPLDRTFGQALWDRFGFSPRDIAKEVKNRASSYQTTPAEFLLEYEATLLEVIKISFEKAAELHQDPEFKG